MTGFIRFFTVALGIYGLANAYILLRAFQGLAGLGLPGTAAKTFLFLWALAYPVGRIAERTLPWAGFSRVLVVSGSFYLGFMVTALFLFMAFDLALLAGRLFPALPLAGHRGPAPSSFRRTILVAVACLSILVMAFGTLNSRFPRVREATIELPGAAGKPLRVALFSDLHMGPLVGNGRVRNLVQQVNSLEPDLVLLVGDIVDEDVSRLAEERMAEALSGLSPRIGSFAVTGNHEYYAGEEEAVSYLESAGIRVLRDEAAIVEDRLVIAGRKDLTANRFGENRLPLGEILGGGRRDLPVLVMDHQPRNLAEAEAAGVDLQVSGHTHNGQLFPFNLVTSKLYEISRGWGTRGRTRFLVSSGVGTWGPPMRTSAAPEIWLLTLNFGATP
jgi:predicted MPP superfamily phosphohydrolase